MPEGEQHQQQKKQPEVDDQSDLVPQNSESGLPYLISTSGPNQSTEYSIEPKKRDSKLKKEVKKGKRIIAGGITVSALLVGAKLAAPVVEPIISSVLSKSSPAVIPQLDNSPAPLKPVVDSGAKKTIDNAPAPQAKEQKSSLPDNSIKTKNPKDWTSANWWNNLPGYRSSLSPDISPTYVTNPTLNLETYGVTSQTVDGEVLFKIGKGTYTLGEVFSQRLNLTKLPFSYPKELSKVIAASDPLGGVVYYYQIDPKSDYEGPSAGFLFLDNYGQKSGNRIPFDVTLLQIPEQVWADPYFVENPSKLQDIVAHVVVNGHEVLASFVNSPGRATNEKVLYYSAVDPANPISELIDTGLSHINVSRLQNTNKDGAAPTDLNDLNGFVITGYTQDGKFAMEFLQRNLSQGVPQLTTEVIGDSIPILKTFEADNRAIAITTNSADSSADIIVFDSSQPDNYHVVHLTSDELTQNNISPENMEIALTKSGDIAVISRGPVKTNGKIDVTWTLFTREQGFKPTSTKDVFPESVNTLVGIDQ